jgi:putative endonuclease
VITGVDSVGSTPTHVYILASQRNGTLYIGVTNDLARRVGQHAASRSGFTYVYGVSRLVHVEAFDNIEEARARERQLKKWRRVWKIDLIEQGNPYWRDLSLEIVP